MRFHPAHAATRCTQKLYTALAQLYTTLHDPYTTQHCSAVPISAGKTDDFLGEVHIELPDEIHASG